MDDQDYAISHDDPVLITGANGFIGANVARILASLGFRCVRCFTRSPVSNLLRKAIDSPGGSCIEVLRGDLLSANDCEKAVNGVKVVYHLAVSIQTESFADAHRNSVEATRKLLDALVKNAGSVRFVNVSSFSVYSNMTLPPGALLDESCPVESQPELRGEAYSYAKIKQEELVREYGRTHGVPYVIIRPGAVYGPGNGAITGRVGLRVLGVLLHLGGSNIIPFTYVDNCADAIVAAGLMKGIDGEVFNVVDDGELSSEDFLEMYKENVGSMKAIYLPKMVSYALFCALGFLYRLARRGSPPKYSARRWCAYWKGNTYSNAKVKRVLGWTPQVPMEVGLRRYFDYCRQSERI